MDSTTNASQKDEVKKEVDHSSPNPTLPARDDEDLLLEYDVILCGTGLVQSILASALARVGKSVLHCDGQGHYGELDTVWTLPFLQEQLKAWNQEQNKQKHEKQQEQEPTNQSQTTSAVESIDQSFEFIGLHPEGSIQNLQILSTHSTTSFPIEVGTKVVTPYGQGTVRELPFPTLSSRLSVSLDDWTLANGESPIVYFGIPAEEVNNKSIDSYLAATHDVLPLRTFQTQSILNQKSRSFALDITPSLVYASGSAVQGMLISGVADYLDFKSIEALLWLDATTKQLSRVPCSKGDVFTSQLLPPLDKRRLMKFLQLTLDYATAVQMAQEEAATAAAVTANEETGTEQESTSGPSDPMLAAAAVSESHIQSLNERQLNQGRALARPQNKSVSTDEFQELQRCIADNVEFEQYLEEKQKISPSLRTLIRYALALESGIGQSTTLQGMTNLCRHMQALGRYGSTAFLFPMYGSGELPQAFCRSAAVHGATYLLRRAPLQILVSENSVHGIRLGGDKSTDESSSFAAGCRDDKIIRCRHVIVPHGAIEEEEPSAAKENQRMLRRISIFRGKLIPSDDGEQRHVVIIPPGVVGNDFAIYAVALDHTVFVAPQVSCGCTVLHLSTMISASADVDAQHSVLENALETLTLLPATQASQHQHEIDEIFHVSFTYDLCVPTGTLRSTKGLHICELSRQGLAVDDAFDHAKEIFTSICPEFTFLAMSTAMDEAVKERFPNHGNEEDDEGNVLKSAVNMLNSDEKEKQ